MALHQAVMVQRMLPRRSEQGLALLSWGAGVFSWSVGCSLIELLSSGAFCRGSVQLRNQISCGRMQLPKGDSSLGGLRKE